MAANFLCLGDLSQFYSHSRYLVTLRSSRSTYHSIVIFHLSSSDEKYTLSNSSTLPGINLQLYAMESQCPHLGADLSYADIEEYEPDDPALFADELHELEELGKEGESTKKGEVRVVAVCPWHKYDFDLKTGKSDTGMRACVYSLEVRQRDSEERDLWLEPPNDIEWEVVECRPVSEAFVDIPTLPATSFNNDSANTSTIQKKADEPVVPEPPPKTLLEWACLVLSTADASLKVQRTRHAVELFRTGGIKSIGRRKDSPSPPDRPPREEGLVIVEPGKVAKRGKGGSLKSRATMLHALACIEQWAIDLAWDIIARFGTDPSLPHQFYTDFTRMALDEAKHFTLLSTRLNQLGIPYGSLPIHSSLWESALETSDCLLARLAIIHLVHEARGLDVNPLTIAKFEKAGDHESVESLKIIHYDEITHVTSGHRWFTWLCTREGKDPVETFRNIVRERFSGGLKGPFNEGDRAKAGMSRDFYGDLSGEKGASVSVGYS